MIIVSDTTILSNFLQINQISILDKIFGSLIIPQEVYHKLSILIQFNVDIEKL